MNKKIIGLTVTLGTGIFLIGQQTVNAADNTKRRVKEKSH